MVESESCRVWVILVWGPGLHFELLLKLWSYSVLSVLKLCGTKQAHRMKTAEQTDYQREGSLWLCIVDTCCWGLRVDRRHVHIIPSLCFWIILWAVLQREIKELDMFLMHKFNNFGQDVFFTFVLLWLGWKLKMQKCFELDTDCLTETWLPPVPCQYLPQCCFSVKSFLIFFSIVTICSPWLKQTAHG